VATGLATGMVPLAPTDWRPAVAVAGVVALALTAAALLRWHRALGWALVAFVVEYALALADRPELDLRAPLMAAGLLMVGELTSLAWGLLGTETEPRRARKQIVDALGLGLGAVVVASVVIAAAAGRQRTGLLVHAVSATAAVGVLLLIVRLARERFARL
jgi:hypothetical protein